MMIAQTPLSFIFLLCHFSVSCGAQINECCIQLRNDLIMHRTLYFSKKEMNAAPRYTRVVTEYQPVDHNPSSP
jgi:hypothetical protein